MKTIIVAAASMAAGAALGWLICGATIKHLRRRVRSLRVAGGQEKPAKMGVMDKVLILEAVVLVTYTVADLVVFWHTGAEPTTLTACVFGVCGLENGVMGWIKTNKDKAAEPSGAAQGVTSTGPEPERAEPPDIGKE